jgi:crotonobetainyl-CoA:carnitine CoA-transferase CaiB-like acyl-CoA transferase
MSSRSAPLAGVKVLDLSRVLAGPWCTQNLADLGADVYKVERPGAGDDTRSWGPPYLKDADGNNTSEAAYYLSTNRNKRSIAIDIASPEGAALVREMASRCDVLVENFKVGGLKKYGLDYESIKAVNPKLIYCSVTGFGQTGPMAPLPGYDFMIQGLGGLMSITGERDDLPGGGPQKAGVAVTDLFTGMYATVAILGALHERNRSGLGQHIDMALPCGHAGQPEPELHDLGCGTQACGQCPPEHCALSGVCGQRRASDRCSGQRFAVSFLLPGLAPSRSAR